MEDYIRPVAGSFLGSYLLFFNIRSTIAKLAYPSRYMDTGAGTRLIDLRTINSSRVGCGIHIKEIACIIISVVGIIESGIIFRQILISGIDILIKRRMIEIESYIKQTSVILRAGPGAIACHLAMIQNIIYVPTGISGVREGVIGPIPCNRI